jgi:hypothetical protein
MNDYDVDEFECEASLVAKTPEARQHFFPFLGFPGFYRTRKRIARLFLKFFWRHEFETRSLPCSLAATLAVLPSISLIPSARFTNGHELCCGGKKKLEGRAHQALL